jgi:hypothetical protein
MYHLVLLNTKYISCGTLSRKKIIFGTKFSKTSTENRFMGSEFWANLDVARQKIRKERKAVIEECALAPNAFAQGIKRKSAPAVNTALKCAQAVQSTVEELVEGETGAEYVREWARRDGRVWQPPEAIADIVDGLKLLDSGELDIIRGAVNAAIAGKKEQGAAG